MSSECLNKQWIKITSDLFKYGYDFENPPKFENQLALLYCLFSRRKKKKKKNLQGNIAKYARRHDNIL